MNKFVHRVLLQKSPLVLVVAFVLWCNYFILSRDINAHAQSHDYVTSIIPSAQSQPLSPVLTTFGNISGHYMNYKNMTSPIIKYSEASICIATIFIGYPPEVTKAHILNHQQYAQTWGYSYFYIDNETQVQHINDGNALWNAKWYKPFVIKNILESHQFEYVLWIDSDAVFMNCRIPLTFLFKDMVNIFHENKYNRQRDYSMLISPDINNMNSGVIMFKSNSFTQNLINLWIGVYYQLESLQFPKYYVWGGDNCALVMILGGYDPNSMHMSEAMVTKYFPKIFAEHIEVVKELQYNEYLLQKSYQNEVGLIPQSMFNSFERMSNTHLLLHCAGSWKCKQLLPFNLATSTCSKTKLIITEEAQSSSASSDLVSDKFLRAFCVFHSFEIQKCIDRILEIMLHSSIIESRDTDITELYHIYYGHNHMRDDILLFILSFLSTQNAHSQLVIWKPLDDDVVTFDRIRMRLLEDTNLSCINDLDHRISVKVFDPTFWDIISNEYNLRIPASDMCLRDVSSKENQKKNIKCRSFFDFVSIWWNIL